MDLADALSVSVTAAGVVVAVIALMRTGRTQRAQQRMAILLPRLEAYDSAVAIGRQLENKARLRYMAKVAADNVERAHAETGSSMPNLFAQAFDAYTRDLEAEVKLLEALHEQSYFPDDMSLAIRALHAAALVRNDVSVNVVYRHTRDIHEKFKRLREVHKAITSME